MRVTGCIFLLLPLICIEPVFAQNFENDFYKEYAPDLQDQNAAFKKFKELLESLSPPEREIANARFGAFALRDPKDKQHCTAPFELGGVEQIGDRPDGLAFFCRRNIRIAAESLATAFLLVAADVSEENKTRALELWLTNAGKLAITDFDRARISSPQSHCIPAYLAYALLHGSASCDGLQPEIVREYMWTRMRNNIKLIGISSYEFADSKSYWALHNTVLSNTSEMVFEFAIFHEIAHLIRGDPWQKTIAADAEAQADKFALRILLKRTVDDPGAFVFSALLLVSHMASAMEEWGKNQPPSLLTRAKAHTAGVVCAIRKMTREKKIPASTRIQMAKLIESHERSNGATDCK